MITRTKLTIFRAVSEVSRGVVEFFNREDYEKAKTDTMFLATYFGAGVLDLRGGDVIKLQEVEMEIYEDYGKGIGNKVIRRDTSTTIVKEEVLKTVKVVKKAYAWK